MDSSSEIDPGEKHKEGEKHDRHSNVVRVAWRAAHEGRHKFLEKGIWVLWLQVSLDKREFS